jgi:hypothetical protein
MKSIRIKYILLLAAMTFVNFSCTQKPRLDEKFVPIKNEFMYGTVDGVDENIVIAESINNGSVLAVLVPSRVTRFGHDEKYIIAEQIEKTESSFQPDTTRLNYYIIDMTKVGKGAKELVHGPLMFAEFQIMKDSLRIENLNFSKTF